jgi:hypothetical protein
MIGGGSIGKLSKDIITNPIVKRAIAQFCKGPNTNSSALAFAFAACSASSAYIFFTVFQTYPHMMY